MKKRGLLEIFFLVLCCVSVFAVEPVVIPSANEKILRYNDFETDNVHILRLSNFSAAVVKEVSGLKTNFNDVQKRLDEIQVQIEELKKPMPTENNINGLNDITGQLISIESEIRNLKTTNSDALTLPSSPSSFSLLLTINIIILAATISTFLFVQKTVFSDDKKQAEFHAQLHLNNAVKNAIKSGIGVEKVRQTFVSQGWKADRVEIALLEAIKK